MEFSTHPSALAIFHSPSDLLGLRGMKKERIRAISSWRNGLGRYDVAFVKDKPNAQILGHGLAVARVRLFFSFSFQKRTHSCAFITDYVLQGTSPDPDTGLWVVRQCHLPQPRVIPLNHILRAAHLIPVYGTSQVPKNHTPGQTLDKYRKFYVNKYADYHSFEIAG